MADDKVLTPEEAVAMEEIYGDFQEWLKDHEGEVSTTAKVDLLLAFANGYQCGEEHIWQEIADRYPGIFAELEEARALRKRKH